MTRYYFGGAYETRSDGTTLKYYSIAGQTVAQRTIDTSHPAPGTLTYFLTDHLGSILTVLDASGTVLSEQRYLPFGEIRTDVGTIAQTDFGFTGQRDLGSDLGLMDYKARFYSAYLNRFLQPDTLIPSPANPQSWNRYSYVGNSPVNFSDPSGHMRIQDGNQNDRLRPWLVDKYVPIKRARFDREIGSPPTGENGITIDFDEDEYGITMDFDTDKFVAGRDGTSEEWAQRARLVNEAALAYDTLLGLYVLSWAVVGFLIGVPFEGIAPVSGPAGAAAGYIMGEGSISLSGAVWPGNVIAGYATYLGAVADAKSGNTSIKGQISISPRALNLDVHGKISSNTLISGTLTTVGLAANIVTLSLPLQAASVANDRGFFGSTNLPVNISISFP